MVPMMDQGVFVALKHRYKKKLLQGLLTEDENGAQSLIHFLKSVNMKAATELIAESCGESRHPRYASRGERSYLSNHQRVKIRLKDRRLEMKTWMEIKMDRNLYIQELGYSMEENEISTGLKGDSNDPGF